MSEKEPQGGAETSGQEPASEGSQQTAPSAATGDAIGTGHPTQELERVRKEAASRRRDLRAAQDELATVRAEFEQATGTLKALRKQIVESRVRSAIREHGTFEGDKADEAIAKMTRLALADLEVEWSKDGTAVTTDLGEAARSTLDTFGFLKAEPAEDEAAEQDSTPDPTPATAPPPRFPHIAQRPTADTGAAGRPQTPEERVAASMRRHGLIS